jgi:predicted  nucleic acid-binding Zn-ribbon protein
MILSVLVSIIILLGVSSSAAAFQPPSFTVVGRAKTIPPFFGETTVAAYAGDPNADSDDLKTRVALIEQREETMTATLSRIEDSIKGLSTEIKGPESKMSTEIKDVKKEFKGLESKITTEIKGLESKMTTEFKDVKKESKEEFKDVKTEIKGLESKLFGLIVFVAICTTAAGITNFKDIVALFK